MSWQMAMMAGQAALSGVQAISGAARGSAAIGRQIDYLHSAEQQAATEADLNKRGAQVRQAQYLTQAAQTDVTSAEVGIQTAQQELMRRRELGRLMQGNAIDLVARGGVATGQDSSAAIGDYNKALTEEDVGTIKLMGESRQRQLSFRKANLEFAAQGEDLRQTLFNLGSYYKQQGLEQQVHEAGAKAQDIGVDTMFKLLSTAMGSVGSIGGGGDGFDMAKEAKVKGGAGAFGLGG